MLRESSKFPPFPAAAEEQRNTSTLDWGQVHHTSGSPSGWEGPRWWHRRVGTHSKVREEHLPSGGLMDGCAGRMSSFQTVKKQPRSIYSPWPQPFSYPLGRGASYPEKATPAPFVSMAAEALRLLFEEEVAYVPAGRMIPKVLILEWYLWPTRYQKAFDIRKINLKIKSHHSSRATRFSSLLPGETWFLDEWPYWITQTVRTPRTVH